MKTLRCGALLLLSLLFFACNSRPAENPDTAFAAYVKGYTGGLLPAGSPLLLELAAPLQEGVDPGTLFSFSPSLDGKAEMEGNAFVGFTPAEGSVRPGKVYTVTFDLGKAVGVKERRLQKFRFRFLYPGEAQEEEAPGLLTDSLPAVTIPLQGNILPDRGRLILPFRAVSLCAVDVRVIQIFGDNVPAFLQDNDLDGDDGLRRSGRLVLSRRLRLDDNPELNLRRWNDFSIDLSGLFQRDPGAIYRIRLSFRPEYSLYGKTAPFAFTPVGETEEEKKEAAKWDEAEPWYWENFVDWDTYRWEDRNNPDTPSYYMESSRFPVVNLLASDLGLIAQYAGGDTMWLSVADLVTAKPRASVRLDVYNYQLQKIGSALSDARGFAQISLSGKPFAVIASSGKSRGYLKVTPGGELSMSRFDVGGTTLEKGLKAYIYGDRGVWRPGDTLHLTMIVADKGAALPEGHPATLELYTPEGQFHSRHLCAGDHGFYCFNVDTGADDPTGSWNAWFKIGGSAFHKRVQIETIKPNRLKIKLDLGDKILQGGTLPDARISAAWLSGAPASGLKAKAEMVLSASAGKMPGFEGYIFQSPLSDFERSTHELFSLRLNADGEGGAKLNLPAATGAPGMLSAFITTSVQEEGGDESFTTMTVPYSPFESYVGLKFPEGDCLDTDCDHTVRVAVAGADGKRIAGHQVEYRVYKLNWSWWWDGEKPDVNAYVNGSDAKPVLSGTVTPGQKDASFVLRIDEADWGRYLVVARDLGSGHVAGKILLMDWPETRGRAARRDPEALTMLGFSADRNHCAPGEKVTVYIPAAASGRALVSLENGSGVISREWVTTRADAPTPYPIKVSAEMAPNFYVHISLIQPAGNADNDLPLRLYGVQRITVDNPEARLQPQLDLPGTVAPAEPFKVKVSEKNGRPMTYTLALVDEGLLDITGFKTPDPFTAMNRTEALGVRTWDLYDRVVGALGGPFSGMLAIGGDESTILSPRKDNRFNPVVQFLGPFTLKKGGSAVHEITLPMYTGSLRAMLVAGSGSAWGSTDRTVTVKAPLMLMGSLPRRAAPGEASCLVVNLLSEGGGKGKASVKVSAEGPVQLTDGSSAEVSLTDGSAVARFHFKTTGEGTARFRLNASSGTHKAADDLTLEVRNPNAEQTTVTQKFIEGTGEAVFESGAEGGTLELSIFPSINAEALYKTMRDYPYDCTEQLAARGITALSLQAMLSKETAAEATERINALIKTLYGRQNADGGFLLWPSGSVSGSWESSMAGLFLSMAQERGFAVQSGVLDGWTKYQKNLSQAFRLAGASAFSELDESFRLYSLAAAGKPQSGAMNALRESGLKDPRARMMLAAAHALCGKTKLAAALAEESRNGASGAVLYGSELRDKAVALDVAILCGDFDTMVPLAVEVATDINAGGYSTQEAAFAAIAMNRLRKAVGEGSLAAEVQGTPVPEGTPHSQQAVNGSVSVKNSGDALLCATLVQSRRPAADEAVSAAANGLSLSVAYFTDAGSLGVASVPQGTEFRLQVKVRNTTPVKQESLALRVPLPDGWEIINERLRGGTGEIEYCDLRDDRADWFFSLAPGAVRTFSLRVRAAYEGDYILPSVEASAMYSPKLYARTASGRTRVAR